MGYHIVARGARDTGVSGAACACWVDYNLLNYPYLRAHPALSQYAVFPHPGRRVRASGLGVCASVRRVRGEWMVWLRDVWGKTFAVWLVSPAVSSPLL